MAVAAGIVCDLHAHRAYIGCTGDRDRPAGMVIPVPGSRLADIQSGALRSFFQDRDRRWTGIDFDRYLVYVDSLPVDVLYSHVKADRHADVLKVVEILVKNNCKHVARNRNSRNSSAANFNCVIAFNCLVGKLARERIGIRTRLNPFTVGFQNEPVCAGIQYVTAVYPWYRLVAFGYLYACHIRVQAGRRCLRLFLHKFLCGSRLYDSLACPCVLGRLHFCSHFACGGSSACFLLDVLCNFPGFL